MADIGIGLSNVCLEHSESTKDRLQNVVNNGCRAVLHVTQTATTVMWACLVNADVLTRFSCYHIGDTVNLVGLSGQFQL